MSSQVCCGVTQLVYLQTGQSGTSDATASSARAHSPLSVGHRCVRECRIARGCFGRFWVWRTRVMRCQSLGVSVSGCSSSSTFELGNRKNRTVGHVRCHRCDDSWDQVPERAPTGEEMDPRLYLGFDQFKGLHPSNFGPGSIAARVRLPIAKTGVGYEKLFVRTIRINAPESCVV